LRDILAMKPDTKVIVASGHGARDRALRAIYGVALAASGNIDGARQLLDKAARLAPGDAVIAGHRRQLG
jgi:Flp pilus assembly protein TadD